MGVEELRRAAVEAETLLQFALEIYRIQLRGGRHFVHEHPAHASSWEFPEMKRLMKMENNPEWAMTKVKEMGKMTKKITTPEKMTKERTETNPRRAIKTLKLPT